MIKTAIPARCLGTRISEATTFPAALAQLSERKEYAHIGVKGAGNNAHFVCRTVSGGLLKELSVKAAYVKPRNREYRGFGGQLNILSLVQWRELVRGLSIVNVISRQLEIF